MFTFFHFEFSYIITFDRLSVNVHFQKLLLKIIKNLDIIKHNLKIVSEKVVIVILYKNNINCDDYIIMFINHYENSSFRQLISTVIMNCSMLSLLGSKTLAGVASATGLTELDVNALTFHAPGLLWRYTHHNLREHEFLNYALVSIHN